MPTPAEQSPLCTVSPQRSLFWALRRCLFLAPCPFAACPDFDLDSPETRPKEKRSYVRKGVRGWAAAGLI